MSKKCKLGERVGGASAKAAEAFNPRKVLSVGGGTRALPRTPEVKLHQLPAGASLSYCSSSWRLQVHQIIINQSASPFPPCLFQIVAFPIGIVFSFSSHLSTIHNEPLPSRLGQSKLFSHTTLCAHSFHTNRLYSLEMMSTVLMTTRTLGLKIAQALPNILNRPSSLVPQSLVSSTRMALSLPPTT
jgi:hypothetical protein